MSRYYGRHDVGILYFILEKKIHTHHRLRTQNVSSHTREEKIVLHFFIITSHVYFWFSKIGPWVLGRPYNQTMVNLPVTVTNVDMKRDVGVGLGMEWQGVGMLSPYTPSEICPQTDSK